MNPNGNEDRCAGCVDAPAATGVDFAHRSQHPGQRPRTAWSDVATTAALAALAPIAWTCPADWWPRVGKLGSALACGLHLRASDETLDAIEGARIGPPGSARRVAEQLAAHRIEQRLQVLRELSPRRWRPNVTVHGLEHIEQGLARGRGVVLWVSHFVFASSVAKIALHRAGLPVVHLSRPEHGFSKTRLGIALINPLRRHSEDRHLAGRIEIERQHVWTAMRRLRNLVAGNGIVSMTVGDWEGHRIAWVPFLGGRLPIATGAPKLALQSGATLLPVHVLRRPSLDGFDLFIEPSLLPASGEDPADALSEAVAGYADGLARRVRQAPGQWRGWAALGKRA
ncbi:MAG: hypothetical protein H6934_02905 [Burkholderiaceae bacterium]|nr:hypothetical protein [Burkholderiaceae bacterium]